MNEVFILIRVRAENVSEWRRKKGWLFPADRATGQKTYNAHYKSRSNHKNNCDIFRRQQDETSIATLQVFCFPLTILMLETMPVTSFSFQLLTKYFKEIIFIQGKIQHFKNQISVAFKNHERE